MRITFVHDMDTGFLARTLKQPLEALGHEVKIVQTLITQIEEGDNSHIDIWTGGIKTEEEYKAVHEVFKETDFFIIRCISDEALRVLRVFEQAHMGNAIYKVHGSELRELGHPYTLRAWRTLAKPLLVCGARDPSLMPLYRGTTITHIERPCDFDIFPKRRKEQPPFAIHTPTNLLKKGTDLLEKRWKSKIPLEIMSKLPRKQVLARKARASYLIDNINDLWYHGPYGMNAVEAWYYKIPVFSTISNPLAQALVPELEYLIIHSTIDSVQSNVENYVEDKHRMRKCKEYALRTHDKHIIAKQYHNIMRYILEQAP